MKWFNIIKDFKYSHGKLADPDMQGLQGYQGVPKEATGFSRGDIAGVNLSADGWKAMLYGKTDVSLEDLESGNYNEENEKAVIREMSNVLSHEYGHVLFRKVSGYTGIESEIGQVLSDIMLGLLLNIDNKNVFDLDKEMGYLLAACKKHASTIILDELFAGYAGKNIEGISRIIIDKYKDYWRRDFNNTLERVKDKVSIRLKEVIEESEDFSHMERLIFDIRFPLVEANMDKIKELMQSAWSDSVDFIYGHFVAVQQKRFYLGTLPERENTSVGEMTTMISRYIDKAGYEDIQRYISGGRLDDKVLSEIGFSQRPLSERRE